MWERLFVTIKAVVASAALLSTPLLAADSYEITGSSGIMYFAAIDATQKDNEEAFRLAVAEACAGKSICQVQFWLGSAPEGFPLSDAQADSKIVQWQQNLNHRASEVVGQVRGFGAVRTRTRAHVNVRDTSRFHR